MAHVYCYHQFESVWGGGFMVSLNKFGLRKSSRKKNIILKLVLFIVWCNTPLMNKAILYIFQWHARLVLTGMTQIRSVWIVLWERIKLWTTRPAVPPAELVTQLPLQGLPLHHNAYVSAVYSKYLTDKFPLRTHEIIHKIINSLSAISIYMWFLSDWIQAFTLPSLVSLIARFIGPTWVLSASDGPHVGPMDLAIWGCMQCCGSRNSKPYIHGMLKNKVPRTSIH